MEGEAGPIRGPVCLENRMSFNRLGGRSSAFRIFMKKINDDVCKKFPIVPLNPCFTEAARITPYGGAIIGDVDGHYSYELTPGALELLFKGLKENGFSYGG